MPLYADSNYYYSGGSSQLFSPYYSGSTTSGAYGPYSSVYNRNIGSSYVIPLTSPSRTSSSYSSHGLSSLRYQPKLSTITESSPLMSSSLHTNLMPLTRIQSPKYTTYSTVHSAVHSSKYIPPRPILINTADIDVSSNRYRKRKQEERQERLRQIEAETQSPTSSIRRREEDIEPKETTSPSPIDINASSSNEEPSRKSRSTIKRNRAVVRLSTIRSRSKERSNLIASNVNKAVVSSEPNEQNFKDQASVDDLSPNREEGKPLAIPPDNQPDMQTFNMPTFHDICADISSDKIDDDLNAGELRRRASIICSQDQELMNELQKTPSGSFQTIHLDRRDSHESTAEAGSKRQSTKRGSKKGKKMRHKITAMVEVEHSSAISLSSDLSTKEKENEEKLLSPKSILTASVESMQEDQKANDLQICKLTKKKSVKKLGKTKTQDIKQETKNSPTKKLIVRKDPKPEVFTFDNNVIEKIKKEDEEPHKVGLSAEAKNASQIISDKISERSLVRVEETKNSTDSNQSKKSEAPLKEPEIPQLSTSSYKKLSSSIDLTTPSSKIAVLEKSKSFPSEQTQPPVATPKPIKKTIKKNDSDEDFWAQIGTRETLYMTNRKKTLVEHQRQEPKSLFEEQQLDICEERVSSSETVKKESEALALISKEKLFKTTKTKEQSTNKNNPEDSRLKTFAEKKSPVDVLQVISKTSKLVTEDKKDEKSTQRNPAVETKAPIESLTSALKTCESSKPNCETMKGNEIENIIKKEDKQCKSSIGKDSGASCSLLDKSKDIDNEAPMQKIAATSKSSLEGEQSKRISVEPPNATLKEDLTAKTVSSLDAKEQILKEPNQKKAFIEKKMSIPISKMDNQTKAINKSETPPQTPKTPTKAAEIAKSPVSKTTLLKSPETKDAKQQQQQQVTSNKDREILKTETSKAPLTSSKIPQMPDALKHSEEQQQFKIGETLHQVEDSRLKSRQDEVNEVKSIDSVDFVKEFKTSLAEQKAQNDKLDKTKMPVIAKSNQEAIVKAKTTTTATTTTPTKITGQAAKSPEQQKQQQQYEINNKCPLAESKNNNKGETTINNNAAIAEKEQLAKKSTSPKEATTKTHQPPTTKQPETLNKKLKEINKTDLKLTVNGTANTATMPPNKTKGAAGKKTAAPNTSPLKSKTKISPSGVINADQFVTKAPNKAGVSPPTKSKIATSRTTTATSDTVIIAQLTSLPDNLKTTLTTSPAAIPASATTTTTAAATTTDKSGVSDINTSGGNNLSKFATVSNLAQCLHDVDADLEDYIPSSAENSDFTDDSDFDLSSVDGCENLTASMKKKLKERRKKEKQAQQVRFDPQKKVKIDTSRKLYVKEEAPRYPLVATPRPLWKREKIVYPDDDDDDDSDDESDSEESGSTEETETSDECTTSEEYEDELQTNNTAADDPNKLNASSIIRMSTSSNDSGFEGGTAPASPKKMLECDVNCHKKCERLTANLCGVNQKLIVEALASVKRGARDTRESPSTPPSSNPAYKIETNEEQDETSYTYAQFQKSGRFTAPATIIPRFKNYSVEDFHFLAVLGKGSFGKVLLAELRDTTYYYAVKCLKKDVVLEDDDVDSTLIERKVLALGTKHPYLCHLFCTFQTESHLFFVMEYLNGGDLMFHIQESGRFTEERARFYGAEIISGLKFLHKKGIIYRDLKLDNVLLDYEGHVRIADFGMCKLQIYLDKTADSFCGTPDYMAPEIIKGEKYNQNVDWWSFGVLLYEMLIGQSPFSGCDEDELFWSICNEIPWFPVYISAEATCILKGLLEKDYTKRVGSHYSPAGDICGHIFFRPIDWILLEKRQIEPPFRPQVKHPLDTQYFDRVFTRERVRLTPIDKDILQSMDQKQFLGFTYTNPHITLD
ncbi:uncharacterized protein LOC119644546 isoform X1 [Glossina fuscipes]|uniref:Uncharacterized protein LOC119644546 isoform X1 n=2 Tax=Nemorhina TaxID=44051 RepID=A0A9C5ZQV9_9MUSC|nr:uncharacterized protein LOC119644546 isoform X1 [Glossina fuscipes]